MLVRDALTTYLDDHLAGARAALALIDRLEPDPRDGLDLRALHREIDADRELLETLLAGWGEQPSGVKRAAGWIAEKLARPKLPSDEALGRFEAFELLSLGILGKCALWRALAAVRDDDPRLGALELERLEARALDQHERVERARLAWARQALRQPALIREACRFRTALRPNLYEARAGARAGSSTAAIARDHAQVKCAPRNRICDE